MDRYAFFEEMAEDAAPLAFRAEHELRIERLRERLGDLRGKRVVEPGCGAGPLTRRLADWVGPKGTLLALDACPGMVQHCRREVASRDHVRVVHGPAEALELVPAAWDLILCFRFYPHVADPAAFLARCEAWLAPGGELVVANLEGSRELNAMHARLAGVYNDRMPSGSELSAFLRKAGWRVGDVIDEPEEFFLRARRA